MRIRKILIVVFLLLFTNVQSQTNNEILLFENFDDPTLANWNYESEWHIENINGNNVLKGASQDFFLSSYGEILGDYSFECKIKFLGNGTNLLFRLSNAGRYFIHIGTDDIELHKESPWGTFSSLLWTENHYDFSDWAKAKVEAIEDSIKFYINDQIIFSFQDLDYLNKGTFGIESFNETTLYIDSIIVKGNPPDSTGCISGFIFDPLNNPVPNYEVCFGIYDDFINCQGEISSVRTNRDGQYFKHLEFGNFIAFVRQSIDNKTINKACSNVISWSSILDAEKIEINKTDTVFNYNIQLESGYHVSGFLVDSIGNPVAAGGQAINQQDWIELGCHFGFGSDPENGKFEFVAPSGYYDISFHNGEVNNNVISQLYLHSDTSLGNVEFKNIPEGRKEFKPILLSDKLNYETFINSALSSPVDVAYYKNKIIVSAPWSGIFSTDTSGNVELFSSHHTYGIEADFQGNLYSYGFPGGTICQYTEDGNIEEFTRIPITFCESFLTISPDSIIWIGYNGCGVEDNSTNIFKVFPDGSYELFIENVPGISAIESDHSGNIYVISGSSIYSVNEEQKTLEYLYDIPGYAGFHGVAADKNGNIYFASVNNNKNIIYKKSFEGQLSTICEFPDDCINGIEVLPDGNLVAVMRCTGAVYYINTSDYNHYKLLIAGNGLSSPTNIVFGINNELFVGNDESGRIAKIANGQIDNFCDLITYNPPTGFFAVNHLGDVFFSEAAPGLGPFKIRVFKNNSTITEILTEEIQYPSGLAFNSEGELLISEYITGKILKINKQNQIESVIEDLIRPEAIKTDKKNNIYISAHLGDLADVNNPAEKTDHPIVLMIDSVGNREIISHERFPSIAVSSQDKVYAVRENGSLITIDSLGIIKTIATGFLNPLGLAFDISGDLFVADANENTIIEISGFENCFFEGTVIDSVNEIALEHAQVSIITDYPNIFGTNIITDNKGNFYQKLAPDSYNVTISCENYHTREYTIQMSKLDTFDLICYLIPLEDTINITESICQGQSFTIGEESFSETGNYSVILQNQLGSDSVVNLDLTVYPVYNINQTVSICQGDSFTVGEESYTETGNYSLMLQNQFGCDSIVHIALTTNPTPEIALDNDTTIFENQEIYIDAGEGYETYSWSSGEKDRIVLVSGLSEGVYEYSVIVTNEFGCSNSDTIIITVTVQDAITDIFENRNILIYPNPANDLVYIRSDGDINSELTISVFDDTGKLLFSKAIESIKANQDYKIDISILNDGIYLLKLNNSESIKIHKVIKNK